MVGLTVYLYVFLLLAFPPDVDLSKERLLSVTNIQSPFVWADVFTMSIVLLLFIQHLYVKMWTYYHFSSIHLLYTFIFLTTYSTSDYKYSQTCNLPPFMKHTL